MEPLNSLAARDVRSVIHPFTDLAHHVGGGPAAARAAARAST